MGSELLLILCLLSGYLFIHATHYFRYRAQTLDGTRLLFETAAAGIPFLIVARVLVTAGFWPAGIRNGWEQLAGVVPYSGSIVGAAAVAIVAASAMNLVVGLWDMHGRKCRGHDKAGAVVRYLAASRCFSLDRAVKRYGNSVQLALHQAATSADEGELVGSP